MSYINSQEQTIYRSLAGQIQLGFYDDGERFPSAQEVARRYGVSYCPAQRALKALEKDGLLRLCRGKETVVLKKPYRNYLESGVFRQRAAALGDLCKTLELLSPSICMEGLLHMDFSSFDQAENASHPGKRLYRLFEQSLRALGSRTALNLYYDVGSFIESAFLDILSACYGKTGADARLQEMADTFVRSLEDCKNGSCPAAKGRHDRLGGQFYKELTRYLEQVPASPAESREPFCWEPHKGRLQYCEIIAIDLICKVNQGIYPVGTLFPTCGALADTYHVAAITIRRTVALLNKLGISQTLNGVGTRVVKKGDASLVYKLKDLMMEDNLRTFLEALQLLAITSGPVLLDVFPYFSQDTLHTISAAVASEEQLTAMIATIGASLQAVIRCSPQAALREIYEKLTLLLLKGSVFRLDTTGEEPVVGWEGISKDLQEALRQGDGALFAATFSRLIRKNFTMMKQNLLNFGVSGIEEISDPSGPPD